jgi:hypothetical protein
MPTIVDITGRRSGRLTATKFHRIETTATGYIRQLWLCKCACGNTRIVSNTRLLSGGIRSCKQCADRDRKRQSWERRQARVQART